MKKTLMVFVLIFVMVVGLTSQVAAQASVQTIQQTPQIYIVQSGDSMWKIAVRFEVGLDELIRANPSIQNPAMIYPGQKITIPVIVGKTYEKEVIRLVNIERAKAGLWTLAENWEMSRVARLKSQDMINKGYFSHTSPTYGSPFTMMKNFGIAYSAAGENIAKGQQTPASVVTAWMNSPGHRQNIMSSNYNEIGVGYAEDWKGVACWTQLFRHR
jgi:uncharacterized YkwD family protein/spore coat assembly protein SafA